jgi:TorA maturation chaperone TorD
MASSDNSPKQHQQEAVEILRDLLTNEDNLKPAKHTTEVRQLFVGNVKQIVDPLLSPYKTDGIFHCSFLFVPSGKI